VGPNPLERSRLEELADRRVLTHAPVDASGEALEVLPYQGGLANLASTVDQEGLSWLEQILQSRLVNAGDHVALVPLQAEFGKFIFRIQQNTVTSVVASTKKLAS
jgi:hypothetical protein